jgi:hypothetical protein
MFCPCSSAGAVHVVFPCFDATSGRTKARTKEESEISSDLPWWVGNASRSHAENPGNKWEQHVGTKDLRLKGLRVSISFSRVGTCLDFRAGPHCKMNWRVNLAATGGTIAEAVQQQLAIVWGRSPRGNPNLQLKTQTYHDLSIGRGVKEMAFEASDS